MNCNNKGELKIQLSHHHHHHHMHSCQAAGIFEPCSGMENGVSDADASAASRNVPLVPVCEELLPD